MAQFDYEKQRKTIGKVINVKEHAACPVLFLFLHPQLRLEHLFPRW